MNARSQITTVFECTYFTLISFGVSLDTSSPDYLEKQKSVDFTKNYFIPKDAYIALHYY